MLRKKQHYRALDSRPRLEVRSLEGSRLAVTPLCIGGEPRSDGEKRNAREKEGKPGLVKKTGHFIFWRLAKERRRFRGLKLPFNITRNVVDQRIATRRQERCGGTHFLGELIREQVHGCPENRAMVGMGGATNSTCDQGDGKKFWGRDGCQEGLRFKMQHLKGSKGRVRAVTGGTDTTGFV